MTDRDIMAVVKNDIVLGRTSSRLNVCISSTDGNGKTSTWRYWAENSDDMVQHLFDRSLDSNVVDVVRNRPWDLYHEKAYNGELNPITGYSFLLKKSDDGKTNITPRLVEFLRVIVDDAMLDKLAYPAGRYQLSYLNSWIEGVPVVQTLDPWEDLERHLEETYADI